jgi:RNA recognition motif-containing protein
MAQELIEPAQEARVEAKDLARYEGEGGREAPEPAAAHPDEPNIMNTKLYVGNLASTTTERELQHLFSPHGNIAQINLPVEPGSGRPRGFGLVTMATPQGAQAAILALNGKEVGAHVLTVTEHVPAR